MTLLRWYNPVVARLALLVLAVAFSLATGHGLVLAGDESSGP